MITVSLHDPNVAEHVIAIKALQDSGRFTEEQLQALYNRAVKNIQKDIDED